MQEDTKPHRKIDAVLKSAKEARLNSHQVSYARGQVTAACAVLRHLAQYLDERGSTRDTVVSVEVIVSALGFLMDAIESEKTP